MTPEERRKLIEEAERQVRQGIMVEPAYDRAEWQRQRNTGTLPPPVEDVPEDEADTPVPTEKPAA